MRRITQDELDKTAETLGTSSDKLKEALVGLGHEIVPTAPPEPEVDYILVGEDGFLFTEDHVKGRGGWDRAWRSVGPFEIFVPLKLEEEQS